MFTCRSPARRQKRVKETRGAWRGPAQPCSRLPHRGYPKAVAVRAYDGSMIAEPLKAALEEIRPKLDLELQPLLVALLADESVEESWQSLLQEILDEA